MNESATSRDLPGIAGAAFFIVMGGLALWFSREFTPAPAASTWRRVALMVVLVAWAQLLERVGFLVTSIACYAAILVISNYDRWTPRMAVMYALSGAAVLGGLYAIFKFVLQVPLPAGMLL